MACFQAAAAAGDGKPWSMPADFLPVPADTPAAAPEASKLLNLRDFNHNQLSQLATEYNTLHGMDPDPFGKVLKGIPERAQLRPGSKEPASFYMGLQGLPPHGRYAKAWKKIIRGSKQLLGEAAAPAKVPRTSAADAAEARAKAAAARAADRAAAAADKCNHPSQWTYQQLQPVLPPEQQRWRNNLAAYLGRPVDVPLLAPDAPVLDMQELFIRVMQQGGYQRMTASNSWAALALFMQRDIAFAPLLAAVYDCYLQPLEQDLPFAFRAAKAQDHMASKVLQRASMGATLASYDSIVYAADRAEALLRQLQPQQEQQSQPRAQSAPQQLSQPPAAAAGTSSGDQQQQQRPAVDIARCSLQLLQAAAREPELIVCLQKQHGLNSGLHQPSRQACMQEYRKKAIAASRKRNASSVALNEKSREIAELQDFPDDVLFGADTTDSEEDDEEEGSQQPSAAAAGAAGMAGVRSRSPTPALAAAAAGAGEGEEEAGSAGASNAGRGRGRGTRGRGRGRGQAVETAAAAADDNDDASDLHGAGSVAAAATGRGRGRGGGRGRGQAVDTAASAAAAGIDQDKDYSGAVAVDTAAAAEQQHQQQQLQLWQSDGVVMDAARWLLLSKRAGWSGPVGWQKAQLHLPGMKERQQDKRASGSGAGRGRGRGRGLGVGKGGSEKKRTRVYLGRVPRCGNCHTCLNPGLKKACVVNRERLSKGLNVKTGRGQGGKGAARGRGGGGRK